MSADFAFLDSGTGGIPYMLSLHEKLPSAVCVYLGDTLNFPYGEKSSEQVTECASSAIQKIIDLWSPKAIVVACNTISVTALDSLREKFPNLPIIGTVPAIKVAAEVTKNKKIGLLATTATVNHPYCQNLIHDFASDCEVVMRADPKLIDFVEKKYFNATEEERLLAVKEAADFFKSKNCDTVILGCTHFTHIAEEMRKACGKEITVVDSRDGVANQAIRKIHEENRSLSESADSERIRTVKNLTFFVTKADEKEIKEYETLCENVKIPWGGVI
ncbi:MAG: glutamate racemase [Treponema sp.]|nr:glutamate racemase [Treponema sp.]